MDIIIERRDGAVYMGAVRFGRSVLAWQAECWIPKNAPAPAGTVAVEMEITDGFDRRLPDLIAQRIGATVGSALEDASRA